jgi:hypothetical protein
VKPETPETFVASFPINRDKLYLLAMTVKPETRNLKRET